MGHISRALTQDVTHWVATPDGYGGFTFSPPTVLKGRWEDKAVLFRNPQGVELTSRSVVYLDADVAVEDYLFEGSSTATDPTTLATARPVEQFHKTPDLRHVEYERKAFL